MINWSGPSQSKTVDSDGSLKSPSIDSSSIGTAIHQIDISNKNIMGQKSNYPESNNSSSEPQSKSNSQPSTPLNGNSQASTPIKNNPLAFSPIKSHPPVSPHHSLHRSNEVN